MHIVPVIDLMHGQVVQAKAGQRENYQPIQSKLTASHQLNDIVEAILQVYPFDCFYIADLNAILGLNNDLHIEQLFAIKQRYPQLNLWLDAGKHMFKTFNDALSPAKKLNVTAIIGSESLNTFRQYQRIFTNNTAHILSIDHFQQGYRGPKALCKTSQYWPQKAIIMNLNVVGTQQGPDISLLKHYRQMNTETKLYAAGGVSSAQDLDTLVQTQINGVLLASALHHKKISHQKIADLMG